MKKLGCMLVCVRFVIRLMIHVFQCFVYVKFSFLSDSSTAQIKQIFCYHSLLDKSAKRWDVNVSVYYDNFFHFINFPVSTHRFLKPKSSLFHSTMKHKGNLYHLNVESRSTSSWLISYLLLAQPNIRRQSLWNCWQTCNISDPRAV